MSLDESAAARRPYYAITSSPLGHLLRKRFTGFTDTLLWEKRPLPLPLRIYIDGGSGSAAAELARSVAGRNVSFINLEEVQPWAPAVLARGWAKDSPLQRAYTRETLECLVWHGARCRDIVTVLKVGALYDAVMRSPFASILWLDMDCFFQRDLDAAFWQWTTRYDVATILRKAYGPDTGILWLRGTSPRVRQLLEDAKLLYSHAARTGVATSIAPARGVNDVQVFDALLKAAPSAGGRLCIGAFAIGCRPEIHARWILDARPYKSKPRQHYCPLSRRRNASTDAFVARSPWNVLEYVTHLKAARGPIHLANAGRRLAVQQHGSTSGCKAARTLQSRRDCLEALRLAAAAAPPPLPPSRPTAALGGCEHCRLRGVSGMSASDRELLCELQCALALRRPPLPLAPAALVINLINAAYAHMLSRWDAMVRAAPTQMSLHPFVIALDTEAAHAATRANTSHFNAATRQGAHNRAHATVPPARGHIVSTRVLPPRLGWLRLASVLSGLCVGWQRVVVSEADVLWMPHARLGELLSSPGADFVGMASSTASVYNIGLFAASGERARAFFECALSQWAQNEDDLLAAEQTFLSRLLHEPERGGCPRLAHRVLPLAAYSCCRRWVGAVASTLEAAHVTYCGKLRKTQRAEELCKARILAQWWRADAGSNEQENTMLSTTRGPAMPQAVEFGPSELVSPRWNRNAGC